MNNPNLIVLRPDENDTVMIELDRPRELKLGHKALKRFSALTGCSMADMEKEVQHYDKLSCLLYVMLAVDAEDHGENLTPAQVDDLLDPVPIKQLMELAMAAVAAAFGEEDEDQPEGESDPPEAAGIGEKA